IRPPLRNIDVPAKVPPFTLRRPKMKGRVFKTAATAAVLCVFAIGGYVLKMWATPAIGVHRTLIGRGTYGGFMVNTDQSQTLNPPDPTVKPSQYIARAQALDK